MDYAKHLSQNRKQEEELRKCLDKYIKKGSYLRLIEILMEEIGYDWEIFRDVIKNLK